MAIQAAFRVLSADVAAIYMAPAAAPAAPVAPASAPLPLPADVCLCVRPSAACFRFLSPPTLALELSAPPTTGSAHASPGRSPHRMLTPRARAAQVQRDIGQAPALHAPWMSR